MYHPKVAAPKDGKPIVLEDDVAGTYDLVKWVDRECAWVAINGKPTNITLRIGTSFNGATTWH